MTTIEGSGVLYAGQEEIGPVRFRIEKPMSGAITGTIDADPAHIAAAQEARSARIVRDGHGDIGIIVTHRNMMERTATIRLTSAAGL